MTLREVYEKYQWMDEDTYELGIDLCYNFECQVVISDLWEAIKEEVEREERDHVEG